MLRLQSTLSRFDQIREQNLEHQNNAGRCLVRRGIFHPGFYCFQQGVEKLLKAILYQVDASGAGFDEFGRRFQHDVTKLYKEYCSTFQNFQTGHDFEHLIPEVDQWFHTRYPGDPKLDMKLFSSGKVHEVDRLYFEILIASSLSERFLRAFNYFQSLEPQNVKGFQEVFSDNRQLARAKQFRDTKLDNRQ